MGRQEILERIRAALGDGRPPAAGRADIAMRMQQPPVGPGPQVEGDLVARAIAKAAANLLTVERIASLPMLVAAVEALLSETGAAADISVVPALADVGWPAEWKINLGRGRLVERLSVTQALSGIAETGSIVLRSAAATPTSLNFLPDTHVIVLRAADIFARPEDVWRRMRADAATWPRTVNVISGPSRTADVGGVVVRPAHGPKRVHVVLLDD
ncbi:MAG: LUD domain-containing protein [Betaproteobacteria bacterium]